MKGLEQLRLHIPISADNTEIGTITRYFSFIGRRTSAGNIAYTLFNTKSKTKNRLLRNSKSALTKNSTATYLKALLQDYLTGSPALKSLNQPVNQCTWKRALDIAPYFKQREQ